MKLHFPWNDIEKILEEINTATTAKTLYEEVTGKGFWLVGDHGVYLMANTTDGVLSKKRQKNEKHFVVYANECNPDNMDFDAWWDNKRASFGGDDGVEFISMAEIEERLSHAPSKSAKPHCLLVEMSPENYAFDIVWKTFQSTKK